jgi:hypothetical protein
MGLSPTGFSVRTLQEIRDSLAADARARIDPTLDVSDNAAFGRLLGIWSERILALEQSLRDVWQSYRVEGATGVSLRSLGALTGTLPEAASYSSVTLSFTLQAGVTVAALSEFRVPGDTVTVWATQATVTNSGGSPLVVTVAALANATGPKAAAAGTITEFLSPVIGAVVTNPADAVLGANEETDAEFRLRREIELRDQGSAALEAIISAVSKVTAVVTVSGRENETDSTVDSLPAHHFEIVIWDGGGSADDDAVAQAIWDNKAAGVGSYGSASGTAVNTLGQDKTVSFTRASALLVYAAVQVSIDTSTWTDSGAAITAIKQALVDYADGTWTIGDDIARAALYAPIFALGGIKNVTQLSIGTSASPSGTADLAVAITQYPQLATARIGVTIV